MKQNLYDVHCIEQHSYLFTIPVIWYFAQVFTQCFYNILKGTSSGVHTILICGRYEMNLVCVPLGLF